MMETKVIAESVRVSASEVFTTMMGLEIVGHTEYMEVKDPGPSDGIIAIVGLAGAWVGTASICCGTTLACQIASAMLGIEYSEVGEDVLDAMSEVANMVVGNFKNTAELYLGPLGLSIPTVIYGLKFQARSPGKEKWLVLPFICMEHAFEVRICLTPNRGLPHLALRAPVSSAA